MVDFVTPAAVMLDVTAPGKKEALFMLAENAAKQSGMNARTLFEILWERERLGTTGVGQGLAIPHGRVPGLKQVTGVFARFAPPLDFDSVDDKAVDLVFILLAPATEGSDHLRALASVSRVLREPKNSARLRSAHTADDVVSIFTKSPAENAA